MKNQFDTSIQRKKIKKKRKRKQLFREREREVYIHRRFRNTLEHTHIHTHTDSCPVLSFYIVHSEKKMVSVSRKVAGRGASPFKRKMSVEERNKLTEEVAGEELTDFSWF